MFPMGIEPRGNDKVGRNPGEEFMELVEDLGAKVNNCNYINEYINFLCSVRQDHPLTFNQ